MISHYTESFHLIGVLIVLGVIFFFIEKIPMAEIWHTAIKVISVIIAVVIVLDFLGVHILPLSI